MDYQQMSDGAPSLSNSYSSIYYTVNTYYIKEALTGIDGVQQLINMVLDEEQRRIGLEDRQR